MGLRRDREPQNVGCRDAPLRPAGLQGLKIPTGGANRLNGLKIGFTSAVPGIQSSRKHINYGGVGLGDPELDKARTRTRWFPGLRS